MSAYINRINRTKVSPTLLTEILERYRVMEPNRRRTMEARAIELFQFLTLKGFRADALPDLALAINFRLEALARTMSGDEVRGWTLPGTEEGQLFLHADVIAAAAEEPIVLDGSDSAIFDPASFRERLLRLAQPQGLA